MCGLGVDIYLQHHHTDLLDTLDDGLGGAGNGDGTLRGVGEHVTCHLNLGSRGLAERERQKISADREMHTHKGNSSRTASGP